LRIELAYTNGQMAKYLYKNNTKTGLWERVKFVQNYYFDDSLQYVKLDLLTPAYSYYEPLVYSYGN
jgi:hypothetical protein